MLTVIILLSLSHSTADVSKGECVDESNHIRKNKESWQPSFNGFIATCINCTCMVRSKHCKISFLCSVFRILLFLVRGFLVLLSLPVNLVLLKLMYCVALNAHVSSVTK